MRKYKDNFLLHLCHKIYIMVNMGSPALIMWHCMSLNY
jgi:hypothetical protein